ncbi:TPA: DUF805 domain-containing protein [Escherichia coli]|nr:DUF805 domain-containing protein [Escherichia coli]HAW0189827.1 DUF805 domain-containing protein [Escherichia coli]
MQWYLAVLKNYVGFSGRARRKEYWMFTLINAIVGAIINVIQLILGLEFPFLSLIYLAATIIPVIGWLVLFVFACLEGNSGSNRYGNDPKFGSN